MRDFEAAQHEAAHVVVGVSLGLRLLRAAVQPPPAADWTAPGYCWFRGEAKRPVAEAIMFAAGVAWERAVGNGPEGSEHDHAHCAALVGLKDTETCVRVARGLLTELAPVHTRVTRALLDRDLTLQDAVRMQRGEWRL